MFSVLRLRTAAIAFRGARTQALRLPLTTLRPLSTTVRLWEEAAVATPNKSSRQIFWHLQLEGHRWNHCREPLVCIGCGIEGHEREDCPNPDPARIDAAYADTKCWRCGDAGHLSQECTQPPPNCYHCGAGDHDIRQCSTRQAMLAERRAAWDALTEEEKAAIKATAKAAREAAKAARVAAWDALPEATRKAVTTAARKAAGDIVKAREAAQTTTPA
ncbi:hypothetical protein B0H16DRAFT_1717312 [Mycena metata]|uniref:CCHC-type domain-containing protein n=1 Tax=Mycena metata TaxID=1033252 RepID=A0AAD7JNC4_9AGAR|nr:hypothetical protein B0H16DRAFT_1717312 [Mycena metata]